MGDILLHTLILLKKPLSMTLAVSMTFVVISSMLNHLFHASRENTLSSFCDYPIVSLLPPCVAASTSTDPEKVPLTSRSDFPSLVEIQHRTLDELTTRAGVGADLALNIKHSELAVRDLIIMIQSSNLTVRDILATTMIDFISEARQTSRSLQILSSKIHGTMDRWVLAHDAQQDAS